MALLFGAATDRVEVADSATVRNLTAATYLAWAYVTSTANSRFCMKGTSPAANYRYFGVVSAALTTQVFRATAFTNATATLTNFAAWGTSKWCFFAATHDTAGANGDQKLFIGDLTTLAAEPSSYSAQAVGSGAVGDNTAYTQYLGNGGTGTGPTVPGRIAVLQIFNRVLTIAEIQSLQFRPRVLSGSVGYWIFGGTTGTQADYSGNANAGTVTGATVADHVPLPAAFGADWYEITPVAQTVNATGLSSSEVQGVTAASPGAVTIAAVGIVTAEMIGSAAVTPGTATVTAVGLSSSEVSGVSAVAAGTATIVATGIATAETLGSVTVASGGVSVAATGLRTEEQSGVSAVSVGAATLAPIAIPSSERPGAASVTAGPVTLTAAGLPRPELQGVASVAAGTIAISATALPATERSGAAQVTPGTATVSASGIASAERSGTVTLSPGAVTLSPAGLSSGAAVGASSLTAGGVTQTLVATGLPSSARSGVGSVSLAAVHGVLVHHVLTDYPRFEHAVSDAG